MNVEIWTEAAQFPEKEYIKGFSLQWGWNILIICSTLENYYQRYVSSYVQLRALKYTACSILGEKSPPARVSPLSHKAADISLVVKVGWGRS
jgi:hypothetical protein